MAGFVQLPQYNPGNQINFEPVQNALMQYRQQQNADRDYGLKQESMAMDQRRLQMSEQEHAQKTKAMQVQRIGAIANAVLQEKDPNRAAAMMGSLHKAYPQLAQHSARYGVDPNDHRALATFLAAEAGQYDPMKQRLQEAQIHQAYRKDEPEIVRTLDAAGIPRGDPRRQEIILNSLKGGDPISQAIGQQINGMMRPQNATPAQPMLQPQSFEGSNVPGLIRVAEPGAQQQNQNDPIVQTPMGPMPQSKARIIGFGLAMQNKGDAGRMFVEGGGQIGKSGQDELDKQIIGRVNDVAELEQIASQFRPEYLEVPTRLNQWGASLQEKFKTGKLTPQDQEMLAGYTRFAAATSERLNERLKLMSGTAVTESEMQRMLRANPNAGTGVFDGDSPTQFKAKLLQQIASQKAAIARYTYLKSQGATPEAIAAMAKAGTFKISLEQMPHIIEQRGSQIEQQIKQQMPNVDQGVLRERTKSILRQEFGI